MSGNNKADGAEGIKFDNSKPDLTDIPLEAMWAMGQALTHGQKKYGKSNFRNGMKASRQISAALRHIYQHLSGEDIDPDSKAPHLGCALASLAMACYTLKNYPEHDDRFEKDKLKFKKESKE